MRTRKELVANYDKLAFEYVKRLCNELDYKPFDRNLLKRFTKMVPDGSVCDLGCGPGHVAAYLQSLGSEAFGIDLSPKMIEEAGRRFSGIEFRVGDMLDLAEIPAESLAGIIAFYSIIHLEPEMLEQAFGEAHRVLAPGGCYLVSVHKGNEKFHDDNLWDTGLSFDCWFFEPDEVSSAMERAGLSVAEVTVRRPYETEFPTERVYILGDKAK
jgi:SAM-dependent methyltransferase